MVMRRSQSADLSGISRERYLSRWSRENTPNDCSDRYLRSVRRSFTPVREIGAYQIVQNSFRSRSVEPYRTPIGFVTAPYHTNLNYYTENEPVRKYDVFQLRTWSYPIYKYIYGRDTHYTRPYSYTRLYANKSLYTPSPMTPELTTATTRRSYSGYNYVAGEHNFSISNKPWSLSNYRYLRSPHVSTAPWYWYGRSNLRHYNSYRPPAFTTRLSTYWNWGDFTPVIYQAIHNGLLDAINQIETMLSQHNVRVHDHPRLGIPVLPQDPKIRKVMTRFENTVNVLCTLIDLIEGGQDLPIAQEEAQAVISARTILDLILDNMREAFSAPSSEADSE